MPCKYPGQSKHPKTGLWVEFPCGRCTPCRIRRRSSWTLRNILESRLALSKSFWTLTFSDSGLEAFREYGASVLVKRFFDRLRILETRAGNGTQIRYFGCWERGDTFGRPHYHFMVYNLAAQYIEPVPYQRGLPRPRYHVPSWPHGHVDVGTFTPASVNYTASYTLEKSSKLYASRRPAIGFYGIATLAAGLAKRHLTLPAKPVFFEVGGRKYPLDPWSRDIFDKWFKQSGGKYDRTNPIERKLDTLALREAWDELPGKAMNRFLNIERMERFEQAKDFERQKNRQALWETFSGIGFTEDAS